MKPLNWMMLYISLNFMMIMINIINYFNFFYPNNFINKHSKKKMMFNNWKW